MALFRIGLDLVVTSSTKEHLDGIIEEITDSLSVRIQPPGYRLPASARVGKAKLSVLELDRSVARATGTKLAYWHCDIAWRTDWRPDIAPLAKSFNEQGISFGAVIGGTPLDQTDDAFVNTGLARLRELQANPATRLQGIVIQSWQPRPSKFLHENQPGTITNLLLRAEAMTTPEQPTEKR